MRSRFIHRTRFVLFVFAAFAVLLIGRLYVLQIAHGAAFASAATDQYVSIPTDTIERGEIIFVEHDGTERTAALMNAGYRLVVKGGSVETPEKAYEQLTPIVELDRTDFIAAAANPDGLYRDVADHLSEEQARTVRELAIEGLDIGVDRWRYYPWNTLAANVLGFVGYRGNERVGQYGLERYWEDTLRHENASLYVNFFAEIFSDVTSLASAERDQHDGDLITNIEPTVQGKLEDVLDSVMSTYDSREVGGIIMNPQTGAIVAMGVRPTFDPNHYNEVDEPTVFANPLVENVYELGSIFKPLTMAAGLDTGAVTARTTYYDAGYIMKSGFRISNYDGQGRGTVDMQEVLNQSLNTGAAFVVDQMGGKAFASYMHAYGLSEETGIDLPNEVRGLTDALDSGVAVDYASASFGQGIAVTPIEMTRALAVLANGGVLVQPHIVSEVRYRSGLQASAWDKPEGRVLKPETAEEITRMLVEVYDDALLGGELKMEHYSIASKTGTAQIARPDGNGYYEDRYLHSFFGYFPAYDPEFIVFLYTREPKGVSYASQTLARPFHTIAQFLINHYNIPPDR